MYHEETLKRQDGSKVSIRVSFFLDSYSEHPANYSCEVSVCEPKKRTFKPILSTNDYSYRKLDLNERQEYKTREQLKFVTAEELHNAKINLWKKLQPV